MPCKPTARIPDKYDALHGFPPGSLRRGTALGRGIGLEDLVEAPARNLTAAREPDAAGFFHVLDDRA